MSQALREAVAVFKDPSQLETAVLALEESGFDRAEISLLASDETVRSELHHIYEHVEDAEDDPAAPRRAFVSKQSVAEAEGALVGALLYLGATAGAVGVVASGGTLAAAILAAVGAGGGGSLIGGALAAWLGRSRAEDLESQIAHGGLLLWVNLRDAAHEEKAKAVLTECGGSDIHVHEIPVP